MQDGLLFRNYQDVSGNTQWSQLVGGTKSSARGDDMEEPFGEGEDTEPFKGEILLARIFAPSARLVS